VILKADRIADLLSLGAESTTDDPLVISPTPNLDELRKTGAASIDLRLGTWFVSLRQARMTHLGLDDPAAQLVKMHYVPFRDTYVLHPRTFVLAVTLEWIRLPKDLAAYVTGRSTWGRRGLIIATATGVHPGFKGCLTLELSNVGEVPISVEPGWPICQLFLHRVETSFGDYVDQSKFVGRRRPALGRVKVDPFVRRLREAAAMPKEQD
jgi:dCTP deaminase